MLVEALIFVATATLLAYLSLRRKWRYWTSLGVAQPAPAFPYGSSIFLNADVLLKRKNMMDVAREQYSATQGHAFYGAYMVGAPMLVVRSPEVAKAVLVRDFAHFVDRRGPAMMAVFSGKAFTDRIWRKQLLSLCGDEWKDVRATFSPIFTSGKLKAMMLFINAVTERLVDSFEQDAKSGREIELKDRFSRFSMDSIASCAFGMDAHAFEAAADGSEFVSNARSIFRHSRTDSFKMMLCSMPPFKFAVRAAGMAVMKPKETMFFYKVLKNTIDERRRGSGRRNDLIDMMIDAMREPTASTEDKPDQFDKDASLNHTAPKKDFDELTIVSTALVLLVAGYDTTAMTMAYLTYELAKNPELQERLRAEVDAACDGLDSDQTLDYAAVNDLQYMDQVLHETLRRYPVLSVLQRACVEDYKMPNSDVVVRKGQEVFINVAGIHSDPEFYPEPNKFDPDRFSKENKAKRHPYSFLGFGHGPRGCIGMRFGMLQAKVALVALVRRFVFVRSHNTPDEVVLDPTAALGASKLPLLVRAEART